METIVDERYASLVDQVALQRAAHHAAAHRQYDGGQIGIRVTDDVGIRPINRQFLGHDYPTDVISFAYLDQPPRLEGELVVSVETAGRRAAELGWPVASELALYVVHGTLHLTGMDDQDPAERARMRRAERQILEALGIEQPARCGPDAEAEACGMVEEGLA